MVVTNPSRSDDSGRTNMKTVRYANGACVAMVAAAVALGLASSGAAAGDTIKIGVAESITGDWAPYVGVGGMRCMAEKINENGGVLGKQLELLVSDSKSDPQLALALAEQMLDNGAIAITGTPASDSLIPIAQMTAESGVITFSPNNTQVEMFDVGLDNFLTTAVPDPFNASAVAEVAYANGARTVVLFLSDVAGTWTRNLPEWFGEAFENMGGKVVGRIEYPGFGVTDWSPYVSQIKAMDPVPDAVHISSIVPDVGVLIRQLRGAGLNTMVLGSDGFDDPTLQDVAGGGANVDGTVFFGAHGFAGGGNALEKFAEECTAKGHQINGAFFGLGGDIITLLVRGIEQSGSEDPRDVLEAIWSAESLEVITAPSISYQNKWHYPIKAVAVTGFGDGGQRVLAGMIQPKYTPHFKE